MTLNKQARNEINELLQNACALDDALDDMHVTARESWNAEFERMLAQLKPAEETQDDCEWLYAACVVLALGIIIGTFVWIMW